MNRERLFKHLEDHYIPKREMISRIPLGVQPDEFWQDVQNRRRARSISLQLHNPRGIPYWYVVTNKMIAASERIVDEMMASETEFDPYRDTPSASSLEESFFTSYVEGSQITMQDAMAFLQGDREPQEPEEQMILNNRNALSFAGANLFRPVDEEYIKTLAYILTENIDGGGQEYRLTDYLEIPSMVGLPYELPTALALPDRVQEICTLLHDPGIHPLIKSGLAQAWVLVTRPFAEGNERLGRLLSQVILFRAGYVFFSEVSLSNLIARSSFAYFNSIANILLPENGADLTYFLEYYMALLDRAVSERHLRLTQWTEEEQIAEREMAQQPLAPPPQAKQADDTIYEEPPFEPDVPGESKQNEGGDQTTIDEIIIRNNIDTLLNSTSIRQRECRDLLLRYLDQGKVNFTVRDIMNDLQMTEVTASNMIGTLRTKGVIETIGKEDRIAIYGFFAGTPAVKPKAEIPLIDPQCFRKLLEEMCNPNSQQGRVAVALLELWDQGMQMFPCSLLRDKAGLTSDQTHKVCYIFKERGILRLTDAENGARLYSFAVDNDSEARKQEAKKVTYSHELISTIQSLAHSTSSPKDRRIGAVLTKCLSDGVIKRSVYDTFGKPERWSYDMSLAARMGLVEKENAQTYRILPDVKPGPGELLPSQKEMATTLYHSFGDEFFSSEMVIATLEYSSAHVCAALHQFTLLKILHCSKENNNTYQFIVNPKENPECFSDVA